MSRATSSSPPTSVASSANTSKATGAPHLSHAKSSLLIRLWGGRAVRCDGGRGLRGRNGVAASRDGFQEGGREPAHERPEDGLALGPHRVVGVADGLGGEVGAAVGAGSEDDAAEVAEPVVAEDVRPGVAVALLADGDAGGKIEGG